MPYTGRHIHYILHKYRDWRLDSNGGCIYHVRYQNRYNHHKRFSCSANAPSSGSDGSSVQLPSIAGGVNPSNSSSLIPANSTSIPRTDSSDNNLPRGAIVGIAIGSGLTCVFLVITTMLLLIRQRHKTDDIINGSSTQLKKIPAYDQNTPGNGELGNNTVDDAAPNKPRGPWSPTSLNPHPTSSELESREAGATLELDSTPVSPIALRVPSSIAGYPSTTVCPSSSVGPRSYGQTNPNQLTAEPRVGQSSSQASFYTRSNPTGSPVSPVFPHASSSRVNGGSYGGISMPSSPDPPQSFTHNAQRPRTPTTINRHSSRMTSNGAGPYLTADRALGDGYWEAEAQQLEADARECLSGEAVSDKVGQGNTREYHEHLRDLRT
ncbi:hypothetical protein AOQ84DRAFT_418108 [Glonium stellatum]|uniref:Uncharacterized protein n=1 Tax=Glonium stellatum TaxID=574774 RepID=A0A8E2F9J9_9PEZI|nr:hypothetical protein AOQ84DRAFT_418108 [Glonium stellatum]